MKQLVFVKIPADSIAQLALIWIQQLVLVFGGWMKMSAIQHLCATIPLRQLTLLRAFANAPLLGLAGTAAEDGVTTLVLVNCTIVKILALDALISMQRLVNVSV